jgi:amidase
MQDLCKLTANKVVGLLKARKVSPLELIDAAEARIAETNPSLNAIPTLCFDRARARARELMKKWPLDAPPEFLYGLPLAVKDLCDVAGVITTHGSPLFANHVADRSDYMVETLEKNGAIVIGKSNTPEFGAGGNTYNEVFGATRNPWDTQKTPGGSSGGAGAALASGQVWLATGSDLFGSIRIPASFCSVVGLRPSPGRVACGPDTAPFNTLNVEGPLARTVADVALMLDAQVGEVFGDPRSLPKPSVPFITAVNNPARPKRIAFSHNLGIGPVDPEVKEICEAAVKRFAEVGVAVEEDAPDLHDAIDICQVLRANLLAIRSGALLETYGDKLKKDLVWNISKGFELDGKTIANANRGHAALFHRMISFFERYDLLVTPTCLAPPFDVETRYLTQVGGTKFDNYFAWAYLTFAITLTACPAISLPCGFTKTGLPVGLQIVGPPRCEARVLSAAALLEKVLDLAGQVPIDPRTSA